MKLLFNIIIILGMLPLTATAQIHTALDTNGSVDFKLFPENEEGKVNFDGIVKIDTLSASQIHEKVCGFLSTYFMKNKVSKKSESIVPNTINYRLEYPIGRQNVYITTFGSPVASFSRDVSHVVFELTIKCIDGRFKYSLSNFRTDRRMLRGEAKNEGEPNIIHWQRVNSLRKEKEALSSGKNANSRSIREKLYDYDLTINGEMTQYQKEYSAIKDLVDGLNNLCKIDKEIEYDEFGDPITKGNNDAKEETSKLDLSSYKGNLLMPKNKVYITAGNPSHHFEWYGVAELIKQISLDSLWVITDKPEQAHFIITYNVNLEGRDHAFTTISSCYSSGKLTSGNHGAGENAADNKEAAKEIYKEIVGWIKPLQKGKTSKYIDMFEYRPN